MDKILQTLIKAANVTKENEVEVRQELSLTGKRHRNYGTSTKWFLDVRDALMWTLKQPEFFGAQWNDQMEDAWFKGYNYAASIMRRELRAEKPRALEAQVKPSHKPGCLPQ